jgi:SAM-dependent methyltransferase
MAGKEPTDHYFSGDYDNKGRFMSYWHQANELIALKPRKVLEIGVGNGFLSGYLKRRGFDVTTLDIDPALKPDITGSVLSLPLPDGSFDAVGCFEVLEHLPFENFPEALSEIRRVCSGGAVISVPDHTPVYRVNVELPRIGEIRRLIPHPFPRLKPHEFDGTHYWMIGAQQYPLGRIKEAILTSGFRIKSTYRVFEFYGHRFFVLERAKGAHTG